MSFISDDLNDNFLDKLDDDVFSDISLNKTKNDSGKDKHSIADTHDNFSETKYIHGIGFEGFTEIGNFDESWDDKKKKISIYILTIL